VRVAWLTWLPVNGWAAEELKKRLNGNGDVVELVTLHPKRSLSPQQAIELVAKLNQEYDAVAMLPHAVILEAARNFKIQNYRKEGMKFARLFSPDFYGDEPGNVRGVRWCQVG
jgi:hypothetical protein